MSSHAADPAADSTAKTTDAAGSPSRTGGLPPLIPREVLFGNPTRTQARLSPDGRHLSWLAPSAEGVLNVWVQPADRSSEARQITADQQRGIRNYGWSQDGARILYVQDEGGDENWHLYAVALAGEEAQQARDLTPFEGVRAQNLMTHPEHPNEVLVGLNKRDPSVFDIYRVQLDSGEIALDTENPGDVVSWLTDADFRIRAAEASDPETGDDIIRVRAAESISPGASCCAFRSARTAVRWRSMSKAISSSSPARSVPIPPGCWPSTPRPARSAPSWPRMRKLMSARWSCIRPSSASKPSSSIT